MKFIDEATIQVEAGNGGDGIVAWRREKYVPKGGPAGGDGGNGGSVFLETTPELSTLVEFRFKRSFAADSGKAGGTSNKSGRSGDDLMIMVPVGTIVYRTLEGKPETFLADLAHAGERTQVAKGGRGGLGNQHFANAVRQAPRFSEKGEPGERCSCGSSCGCWPIAGSSAFRTPANRRCSRSSRPRGRRSPTTRSPRSNRNSASCASRTRNRS